jgi:LPXTG-motif cell wall-anchored protein
MYGSVYYFAQSSSGYGCLNYGETTGYNSCEQYTAPAAETTTGTASQAGGTLANTGAGIYLPIVVSIVLILGSIVLFKKR